MDLQKEFTFSHRIGGMGMLETDCSLAFEYDGEAIRVTHVFLWGYVPRGKNINATRIYSPNLLESSDAFERALAERIKSDAEESNDLLEAANEDWQDREAA